MIRCKLALTFLLSTRPFLSGVSTSRMSLISTFLNFLQPFRPAPAFTRVLKRHDYAHCCSSQKPGSCFSLPPSLHESSSLVDAAYVPPTTPPHSLCSLFTGHLSARRAGCALLLLACNLCRHPLCWGHTALSFTQTLPIHLKGAIPDWITSLNT